MEIDIATPFFSAWNAFSQSNFFFYVKIIAGFATAVLLVANILLLSKRVRTDMRIALYGSGVPRLKKSKFIPVWESVKRRLDEKSVASGKVAIIEADKILDEVLGKLGYAGKNTEEKISNIKPGQLVGIDDMREVHALNDKIIKDPAYEISMEEIKTALLAYERIFRGLNIIE
ncbi:MAG: hypothetical protein QMD77_00135 [Patescibacteria group bacterium]|nr:hypothetical protein [Patescibacteria group bacterium]